MRLLTLVRHAKASSDYPELSDFERPLNPRGRRDAPVMAARLAKAGLKPDRLVSSPAARAFTTARLFAEPLGMAPEEIEANTRIYEASPHDLMQVVRRLAGSDRHVMLFGHNPGISQLAQALADCPFADMPTCAVVHLQLNVKNWAEVTPGCGQVLSYDHPKQEG